MADVVRTSVSRQSSSQVEQAEGDDDSRQDMEQDKGNILYQWKEPLGQLANANDVMGYQN